MAKNNPPADKGVGLHLTQRGLDAYIVPFTKPTEVIEYMGIQYVLLTDFRGLVTAVALREYVADERLKQVSELAGQLATDILYYRDGLGNRYEASDYSHISDGAKQLAKKILAALASASAPKGAA